MNKTLAKFAFARAFGSRKAETGGFLASLRAWSIDRQILTIRKMHSATRRAHVNLILQGGGLGSLRQVVELGSELSELATDIERLSAAQDKNAINAGKHAGNPEGKVYEQEASRQRIELTRIQRRYTELQYYAESQGFDVPDLLIDQLVANNATGLRVAGAVTVH